MIINFLPAVAGKSPTICLGQSYYLCIAVLQESRNRPSEWFANGLLVYIWKCILKYILWIHSKNIYPWQLSQAQSSPTAFAVVQGIFDLLSVTLKLLLSSATLSASVAKFYRILFFWLFWATDSLWSPKIIIASTSSYSRCWVSFLIFWGFGLALDLLTLFFAVLSSLSLFRNIPATY